MLLLLSPSLDAQSLLLEAQSLPLLAECLLLPSGSQYLCSELCGQHSLLADLPSKAPSHRNSL